MSTSTLPSQRATESAGAPAWKDEISERLRAHRTRRSRVPENQPALPGMEPGGSSSSIAARVAERYSRVPSYRDMLAAKAAAEAAERAAAEAAAEAARAESQRAATASSGPDFENTVGAPRAIETSATAAEPAPEPWQPALIHYSVSSDSLPAPRTTPAEGRARAKRGSALPSEASPILDPLEEALVEPASPLPARVIEFPRELVAPRKARPRLAEGPLRDEESARSNAAASRASAATNSTATETSPDLFANSQELRICEAEPDFSAPESVQERARSTPSQPEWHSIQLDTEARLPNSKPNSSAALLDGLRLHVASLGDRAMAAIVDVSLTLAAFLAFVLVFAVCTTHPPAGRIAVAGAGITLLAMWILYQFVFFGLSDATPGMRYAKIALCTFDDENPTRAAMRGRIAAFLLSALPLGLGFIWAAFDEDALGWHDRITQTYQRSYRDL